MARRASKVEKFTQECMAATDEELAVMGDILRAVRARRQPAPARKAAKPKAQQAKPNSVGAAQVEQPTG